MRLVALACLALVADQALAAAPAAADRQELERLASLNDRYWDEKDVERISGQYVADATIRVGPIRVIEGKEGVRAFFANQFARREGEMRHLSKIEHLEALSPDLVLADNHVRIERADDRGGWQLVGEFRTNSLAVRDGGSWKIKAVRGHPLPKQ